jgi:hypothetical protein
MPRNSMMRSVISEVSKVLEPGAVLGQNALRENQTDRQERQLINGFLTTQR